MAFSGEGAPTTMRDGSLAVFAIAGVTALGGAAAPETGYASVDHAAAAAFAAPKVGRVLQQQGNVLPDEPFNVLSYDDGYEGPDTTPNPPINSRKDCLNAIVARPEVNYAELSGAGQEYHQFATVSLNFDSALSLYCKPFGRLVHVKYQFVDGNEVTNLRKGQGQTSRMFVGKWPAEESVNTDYSRGHEPESYFYECGDEARAMVEIKAVRNSNHHTVKRVVHEFDMDIIGGTGHCRPNRPN